MGLQSVSQATGGTLASFEEHTEDQVQGILSEVMGAFPGWRDQTFAQRGAVMRRPGASLPEQTPRFARMISEEMGKPIVQAEGDFEKCAWTFEFYADNAETMLA